jgi:hypothetical protein
MKAMVVVLFVLVSSATRAQQWDAKAEASVALGRCMHDAVTSHAKGSSEPPAIIIAIAFKECEDRRELLAQALRKSGSSEADIAARLAQWEGAMRVHAERLVLYARGVLK